MHWLTHKSNHCNFCMLFLHPSPTITCTFFYDLHRTTWNHFLDSLLPGLPSASIRHQSPSSTCLQISFRAFTCHLAFISYFSVVGIFGYLCSDQRTHPLSPSISTALWGICAPPSCWNFTISWKPFIILSKDNPSAAQARQQLMMFVAVTAKSSHTICGDRVSVVFPLSIRLVILCPLPGDRYVFCVTAWVGRDDPNWPSRNLDPTASLSYWGSHMHHCFYRNAPFFFQVKWSLYLWEVWI